MSPGNPEDSYLQRIAGALFDLFQAPIDVCRKFFGDLWESDETTKYAESTGQRIVGLVTLPFRLFVGFCSFVLFSWASSRSIRAFLLGVPAILGLLGYIGAVLAADMFRGEIKMIETNLSYYHHNSMNAPEHPEWAEIFGRRLVEENPTVPEYKYLLAESVARKGEVEEAEDLMKSIAPVGDQAPGYGKAHLWLANQLTNQANNVAALESATDADIENPQSENPQSEDPQSTELTKDLEELALAHYQSALEALPEMVEPQFHLGRMYEMKARRFPEGSEEHVAELVKARTRYRFGAYQPIDFRDAFSAVIEARVNHHYKIISVASLAKVRMALAKQAPSQYPPEQMKTEIMTQVNTLFPGVRRSAADDYRLWRTLILCSMEAEDYERTSEIINAAIKSTENANTQRRLRQYAADAQVIQAKKIKNLIRRPNYAARLRVLCRAVVNNPRNLRAYELLLEYVGEPVPVEDPINVPEDYVPVNIEWLISEGSGSPYSGVINALAGIHFMDQGKVDRGRKYWEIGSKFDPNTKRYVNFMLQAICLRDRERPFNNIRDMLALAIESFSGMPELYATRAAYSRRQKQFEDAVRDYEAYLRIRPEEVSVLQFAKLCHRELGNEDAVIDYDRRLDEAMTQYNDANRANARKLLKFIEEKF